jgi:hypothetical protein
MDYEISIPGRFAEWMDGTGLGQGEQEPEIEGFSELSQEWHSAERKRRGRGFTISLVLSRDAMLLLGDYAATCYECEGIEEDGDHAQGRAGLKVRDEIMERMGVDLTPAGVLAAARARADGGQA